jgi:hypothetical protein
VTTTWRADVTAAVVAILNDEVAANPTLLRKAYPSRPGSFGETPAAYISGRAESITHDSGTRTRTFDGLTFTIVDSYRDNIQTTDPLDDVVDNLVDRFDIITNVQRIASSIIEITSIVDVDVELLRPDGTTVAYRGVVFTLGRTAKLEGRQ